MNTKSQTLAEAALGAAFRGAHEYLAKHKLTADVDALSARVRSCVKQDISSALDDAREAINAHMETAAMMTFQASMVLAGIRAAKDVLNGGQCVEVQS